MAWALCRQQQHRVQHPLIYPRMVHALIGAHNAGRDITDALREVDWHPHAEQWLQVSDQAPTDQLPVVYYESWHTARTGPYGWERHWPGLVASARAAQSR
jgi:hypothetical protein